MQKYKQNFAVYASDAAKLKTRVEEGSAVPVTEEEEARMMPTLSSRLRSSHSSLHSASASPLSYSDSHCPGTFGHSVSQYSNEQGNFMELSPPNLLTSLSSLSSRYLDLSHHFHILHLSCSGWDQAVSPLLARDSPRPSRFLIFHLFCKAFAHQTFCVQVAEPSMLPYRNAPPSNERGGTGGDFWQCV